MERQQQLDNSLSLLSSACQRNAAISEADIEVFTQTLSLSTRVLYVQYFFNQTFQIPRTAFQRYIGMPADSVEFTSNGAAAAATAAAMLVQKQEEIAQSSAAVGLWDCF